MIFNTNYTCHHELLKKNNIDMLKFVNEPFDLALHNKILNELKILLLF